MDEILDKIKAACLERKITLKELIVNRLKIAESGFYYSIKNKSLRVETIIQIAKILDKPVSYFFDEKSEGNDFFSAEKMGHRVLYGLTKQFSEEIEQLKKRHKDLLRTVLIHEVIDEATRNWKDNKALHKRTDKDSYILNSIDDKNPELPKKIAALIYHHHIQEDFKSCEFDESDKVFYYKYSEILKELNSKALTKEINSNPTTLKKLSGLPMFSKKAASKKSK